MKTKECLRYNFDSVGIAGVVHYYKREHLKLKIKLNIYQKNSNGQSLSCILSWDLQNFENYYKSMLKLNLKRRMSKEHWKLNTGNNKAVSGTSE